MVTTFFSIEKKYLTIVMGCLKLSVLEKSYNSDLRVLSKKSSSDFSGFNWLDYGARFYDPAVGRFTSVDPLAEITSAWNGYHYVRNNPISRIDPTGLIEQEALDPPRHSRSNNIQVDLGGFYKNIVGAYGEVYGRVFVADNTNSSNESKNNSSSGEEEEEEDCCPDGGVEWRANDRAERYLKGSITVDEFMAEIEAELDGAMLAAPIPPIFKLLRAARWGKAAKASSKILDTTAKQLQKKFKHAGDFGITGNYSKANSAKFSSAINQHLNSSGVKEIQGTYRGNSVSHFVNPNTGLNVIVGAKNEFISGWKLGSDQLMNVLKHGGLN